MYTENQKERPVLLILRWCVFLSIFTGLASCEQGTDENPNVGGFGLDTNFAETEPANHNIASLARSLAEDVNSGQIEQPRFGVLHNVPLLGDGPFARVIRASASGNRITLEVSNPVGGISRSLARSNISIEHWQRTGLCGVNAFEAFIAMGGEIEVDLQSGGGRTLHTVVIRDCD
jgi:hypothetical protein